jgi:hypothetical protein
MPVVRPRAPYGKSAADIGRLDPDLLVIAVALSCDN